MRVWKNGKEPPYMYGTDRLTPEKVQYAVSTMTYSALQTAAASFLLLAQSIGKNPAQMMEILEADNKAHPVTYTPERDVRRTHLQGVAPHENWQLSRGACCEVDIASVLHIPVQNIEAWIKEKRT